MKIWKLLKNFFYEKNTLKVRKSKIRDCENFKKKKEENEKICENYKKNITNNV